MNVHESEWESLAEVWRAAGAPVDLTPLRRKVAAHRRLLIAATVGEVLVVAGFVWLSAVAAGDGVEPWEAVWLATLWGFTLLAFAFVWWNRRGTWSALGESVEEFVRLTRLRAERQMRSIYFSLGLFVAQTVIVAIQLAWFGRLTVAAGLLLAAFGALVAAWCWAMRKKVARDLAAVEEYDRGRR
jgi:hypothetical protein